MCVSNNHSSRDFVTVNVQSIQLRPFFMNIMCLLLTPNAPQHPRVCLMPALFFSNDATFLSSFLPSYQLPFAISYRYQNQCFSCFTTTPVILIQPHTVVADIVHSIVSGSTVTDSVGANGSSVHTTPPHTIVEELHKYALCNASCTLYVITP